MIDACEFTNLGFVGRKFTWANLHMTGGLVQERLDRVLATSNWRLTFPEATVSHLPQAHMDHCPLKLVLNPRCVGRVERPFRCELMWFNHPIFGECFQKNLREWNAKIFGNIFKRK